MSEAADVGIAWSRRWQARAARYGVIDSMPAKFCSGHIILSVVLSLRHFGWRAAAHYPLAGVGAAESGAALLDRREPPISLFSDIRCAPIDGARAVWSYRVEPHRRRRDRDWQGGSASCSLSDISAGAMLLIIPWRGWAPRNSGAALLDRREPPIFLFSEIRCAPIDGARAVWSYRVEPHRRRRDRDWQGGSASCSLSDISAGAMLLIIPWRGWAPRNLARRCSTGASRRFSFLADIRCAPIDGARAVRSYRVEPHRRRRDRDGQGGSASCSLSDISAGAMLLIIPWRGWAPRNLARRCSTGASRRFSFLAYPLRADRWSSSCSELPGRTASAAPRSRWAGGLSVVLSLRHFGWRDAAHYPLAGVGAAESGAALLDRREPPIFLFSKFRCAPIDGARELFGATGSNRIVGAAIEMGRGAQRRALSPTFRLARCCSLSLGGGGRRGIWRGAARPARAADFPF